MGCGASSQPNRAPDAVLPGEAAQSKGRTDFEPPLEPLRSPPTSGAALTNTGGEAMANPVLESRPPIPEEQNICSSKEIVGENKVLKERNCSCGARWSELDKHVVEWSEQVVKELVEKFERNLEEERQRRLHAESQKDMLITEHHEWIAQAEEDFDRELDGLREQYEVSPISLLQNSHTRAPMPTPRPCQQPPHHQPILCGKLSGMPPSPSDTRSRRRASCHRSAA
eukprot:3778745-Rhodomonas_salina.1